MCPDRIRKCFWSDKMKNSQIKNQPIININPCVRLNEMQQWQKCSICKSLGHTSSVCKKGKNRSLDQPQGEKTGGRFEEVPPEFEVCWYCNRRGHSLIDCEVARDDCEKQAAEPRHPKFQRFLRSRTFVCVCDTANIMSACVHCTHACCEFARPLFDDCDYDYRYDHGSSIDDNSDMYKCAFHCDN